MLANAEPFAFARGPSAALLIHGFTGSPRELRPLGESLAAKDISVSAPLLAGHGTTPEDLARTTWPEWIGSAAAALSALKQEHDRVALIGFSLGGLIALNLAAGPETAPLVDRVVLIGCPVIIFDRRARFSGVASRFIRFLPAGGPPPELAGDIACYDKTPVAAASQLWTLIRRTRRLIPGVKQPTLIIQGDRDRTVRPESAPYLEQHLGSERRELVWARGHGHLVPVEAGREEYFARIAAFLGAEVPREV